MLLDMIQKNMIKFKYNIEIMLYDIWCFEDLI
jgi:hypothetical protein